MNPELDSVALNNYMSRISVVRAAHPGVVPTIETHNTPSGKTVYTCGLCGRHIVRTESGLWNHPPVAVV